MRAKEKSPPKGSVDDLIQALREAETQHQKQRRSEKRWKKLGWIGSLAGKVRTILKWSLIGGVFVFLGLVFDGLRREGREIEAHLVETAGPVTVTKSGQKNPVAARKDTVLINADIVATGPNGSATVVFPD